ncbi:MAG: PIN domain-containing protein [Chitinophagaceae bacterium]
MQLIYIDANIYLRFYDSFQPEFKKLLHSVCELADKIFITEQVFNEIERNKLNLFQQSVKTYTNQAELKHTMIPEHMDGKDSKDFSEWNKKRKSLEEEVKSSNQDLKSILAKVVEEIAESKDGVSTSLKSLHEYLQRPRPEILIKARLRKELGNPPGKKNDPLGDQLTWEQLLEVVPLVKSLWIITADGDYFTEHQKQVYLNPVLYNDIISLNPVIELKVYNLLADALRDYNKIQTIASIPDSAALETIAKEEKKHPVFSADTGSYTIQSKFPIKPMVCPNCNHVDSFADAAYLKSKYGGLTLQYIYNNCGFHYDTGDFF